MGVQFFVLNFFFFDFFGPGFLKSLTHRPPPPCLTKKWFFSCWKWSELVRIGVWNGMGVDFCPPHFFFVWVCEWVCEWVCDLVWMVLCWWERIFGSALRYVSVMRALFVVTKSGWSVLTWAPETYCDDDFGLDLYSFMRSMSHWYLFHFWCHSILSPPKSGWMVVEVLTCAREAYCHDEFWCPDST